MDTSLLREKFSNALQSEQSFLYEFLGLTISYEDECCTVEFEVEEFMLNPRRYLHGGIIAFVIDTSMAYLCKNVVGSSVTIEMKTQYFRPAQSGKLTCEARFLKKGKSISFIKSDLKNKEGKLVAQATGTFATLG